MVMAEQRQTKMRCTDCGDHRREVSKFVMAVESGPTRSVYLCAACHDQLSQGVRIGPRG